MSLTQSRSMGAATTQATSAPTTPVFVASQVMGTPATRFVTSLDGSTWSTNTNQTSPAVMTDGNFGAPDLATDGTNFVVATGGSMAYTATPTGSWTVTSTTTTTSDHVYYAGSNLWVAYGLGAAASNQIWTSTDRTTWTSRYNPGSNTDSTGNGLFNGGYHVIPTGGVGFRLLYTSTADGSTGWTYTSNLQAGAYCSSVVYNSGSGLYVAVGYASGAPVIYTSLGPASTWTAASTAITGVLLDVKFNGTYYMIMSSNGNVATSSNGTTWTTRSSMATSSPYGSLAWSPTLSTWCAVIGNKLFTNPTPNLGTAWTDRSISTTNATNFVRVVASR